MALATPEMLRDPRFTQLIKDAIMNADKPPVNADLVNHSIKTDRIVLLVDSEFERARRLNCIDESVYLFAYGGCARFLGRAVIRQQTLGE